MYSQYTNTQKFIFIALLVIATIAFGVLLWPLVFPLFWAVVFGVLFRPVYERIRTYTRGRATLATLLTLVFMLIVMFVPLILMVHLVANEAVTLYYHFSGTGGLEGFDLTGELTSALTWVQSFGIDTAALETRLASLGQTASAVVANSFLSVGSATVSAVFQFMLMLYLLFFVLRDGRTIGAKIKEAFPLPDEDEQMLFNRFAVMTRAIFKGTLVVALIQGVIGGVLFAVAGISSPALWAMIMAVLALIPAVGPALVWVPAGVLLLLAGHVWQGVLVLAVGALVISLIDNILRPLLVGGDTGMPDVFVLVSVLGGLALFGIAGLIIGPAITALFLALWEMHTMGTRGHPDSF